MTDQIQTPSTNEKPPYEKPQIIPLSNLTAGQGLCGPGSADIEECFFGYSASTCFSGEIAY